MALKLILAALDKRWKIRCFYITGIFARTIFLYNSLSFFIFEINVL